MQYRKLPKGAEQISVLGIGTSSIQASSEKEIEEIMDAAIENGINFFDMASSEAKPFATYGRAIKDRIFRFILVRTMKQELMDGQQIWILSSVLLTGR